VYEIMEVSMDKELPIARENKMVLI
jgi:hypothetical protein